MENEPAAAAESADVQREGAADDGAGGSALMNPFSAVVAVSPATAGPRADQVDSDVLLPVLILVVGLTAIARIVRSALW
jgi:hypothetical protein